MPHGDLAPVEAPHNERLVILTGIITTSTSGTVASSDCVGCTVAKTGSETGRYTVTPTNKFLKLMYGDVTVEGSADAAVTDQKATNGQLRGVATTTPILYLQMLGTDSDGDATEAEVEDGAIIRFMLVMSRGKC